MAESNRDRAYKSLKEKIFGNELQPGQCFLESEVAEMLQMSRTPVREAMLALEADGLVEIRPRRGMYILPVSAGDMAEIYDLLSLLEGEAAALACRDGADPAHITAMAQSIEAMEKALENDDLDTWAAEDGRFHDALVWASGNKRLITLVDMIIGQAHRVRMMTLRVRPKPVSSNEDHRKILEAILAKKPQAARRAIAHHRRSTGVVIFKILAEMSETASE